MFFVVFLQVFIAGNKHYIVQRPSIKNFYEKDNKETIFFNTTEVSKPDSTSDLVKVRVLSSIKHVLTIGIPE